MSDQEVVPQYVDIEIVVNNNNGSYENIFDRTFGVAGIPRKGDIIRVDSCKYEVQQIEFSTQKSEAHIVTVYVNEYNDPSAAFFCRRKKL